MGYYGKAEKATEEYKIKTAEEKIKLAILSYQASKESTTVYDELIKIEGLSFITPTDPNEGPPYTVVVDSYQFLIKEDLSIEYKGETDEAKANQPEITKVEYETGEVETLRMVITAKTEDGAGLAKIDVYYKKQEGEEITYETIKSEEVSGTEATITVEIPINGEYVIQAIGKNEKIGTKEININNIKEGSVLVSVKQGEMNNQASTSLVIKGRTEGKTIEKMELYVKGEKVKTYEYKDLNKEREETYVVENLEFYKNVECYIKAWDSRGTETKSEIETIKNTKIIKTATDMKNLATQVNDYDNTFEGRTLQLVATEEVNLGENWIPIGYYDATGYYTGKHFAGTFEGNNHTMTINSMNKEEKYKSGGLFGMVIGGTIKNVTINGKIDSNTTSVGGIVGTIRNGTIYHCTNNSEITNLSEEQHGGIVGTVENSHIENCTNTNKIYGKTSVGGICGGIFNETSSISNCINSGMVKCYGVGEVEWGNVKTNYGVVGGICGITKRIKVPVNITNCTNLGEVTVNVDTIFPNGISAGGILGWSDNAIITTSKNIGSVHCDANSGEATNGGALGGIAGGAIKSTITQCFNTAIISSKYNNNYSVPNVGGIVGYQVVSIVKNTYNKGNIYGSKNVGGLIGVTEQVEGITGKNYLFNNYNASETVIGQEYVGNYAGTINYAEGAYNSAILNKTGVAGGENNTFTDYKEFTRTQMKTLNSGLLTLLQKGDGNGLWAQNTNVNEGFPYLINNQP